MSIRTALVLSLLWMGVGAFAGVSVDDIQGAYVGGSSPPELIKKAVGFLNDGMDALYGKRYFGLYTKPTQPCFAIGSKAAIDMGWITQAELDSVAYGGYVVRTTPGGVAIAGKTNFDTIVGVQEYIRYLGHSTIGGLPAGVREIRATTKPTSRILPDYSIAYRPPMPMRNYYNRDDQARPDTAMAIINPEIPTDLWLDHSAGFLIPKDLYYDAHPEYFALVGGKRIAKEDFIYKRTPLCLSNPDVLRISAERALRWVEVQPEYTIFPITYGDTRIWCECAECKALDHWPGQHAGRLLHWVNYVADAIGAKYPDITVITFAYGGSDMAPSNIAPRPNVTMVLSSGLDMPFYGHREKVGALLPGGIAKIKSWHELCPGRVWVCEYSEDLYHPAMPLQIEDRLRWYYNHGVTGIMYSYGYPITFKALWSHIYGRLMMDLSLDAQTLAEDFALRYYAEGGPAMARYFALSHKRYKDTLQTVTKESFINGHPADYYSNTFIEAALDAFQEAMDKTAWEITKEIRPEMMLFSLDALRRPGPGSMDTVRIALMHRLMGIVRDFSPNVSDAEKAALGKKLYDAGVTADTERPGSLAVVKEWLLQEGLPIPAPSQSGDGVTVYATDFLFGHGPFLYNGGHRGPEDTQVPVMHIYVAGNDKGRSDKMTALFELYTIPAGSTATLALLGQDNDDPNMAPTDVRVEVNGQVLYTGPTEMLKWDWSWHYITVPTGLLQEGVNQLTITNVSSPSSINHWHQRWYMLVRAKVSFN